MKTTLALLITGLIFLATPMLASADRGHRDSRQNHYNEWVKNDRYEQRSHYNNHHYQRDYRYKQRANRHVKTPLRRELRKTRRELHQIKQQIRRNRQRSYYAQPAVVIGLPHLVFQFDW